MEKLLANTSFITFLLVFQTMVLMSQDRIVLLSYIPAWEQTEP